MKEKERQSKKIKLKILLNQKKKDRTEESLWGKESLSDSKLDLRINKEKLSIVAKLLTNKDRARQTNRKISK